MTRYDFSPFGNKPRVKEETTLDATPSQHSTDQGCIIVLYRSAIITYEDLEGRDKGKVYVLLYEECRRYLAGRHQEYSKAAGLMMIEKILRRVLTGEGKKAQFLICDNATGACCDVFEVND
ncbi:hypothetical protein ACFLU6_05070 [Acidobacteriota bacterium]